MKKGVEGKENRREQELNPLPVPKLLTQNQVAEALGVSQRTLEGWRYRGGGPEFIRAGSRVRYSVEDLRAWIEERKRVSTSDDPHIRG